MVAALAGHAAEDYRPAFLDALADTTRRGLTEERTVSGLRKRRMSSVAGSSWDARLQETVAVIDRLLAKAKP